MGTRNARPHFYFWPSCARLKRRRAIRSQHSLPLHRRGQISLRKNAPIVIPQAVFAEGVCFLLGIRAKSRSLSRRCGIGMPLAVCSAYCEADRVLFRLQAVCRHGQIFINL